MHVDLIEPTDQRSRDALAYGYPSAEFEAVAQVRDAFFAVAQTLREHRFVSMFVRLHPILALSDRAFTGLGPVVEHGQTASIDLCQNEAEQLQSVRSRHRILLNRLSGAEDCLIRFKAGFAPRPTGFFPDYRPEHMSRKEFPFKRIQFLIVNHSLSVLVA